MRAMVASPTMFERAEAAGWRAWLALPMVFILLYNPTFQLVNASLVRLVVLFGLVAGVIAGRWLVWPRQLVERTLLLVGSFSVALGTAQMIAMRGGGDATAFAFAAACLTGFIPAAYVVARYGAQGSVNALLRLVAWVGAFQSVCIALDWISPQAHELFRSLVVQPDLSNSLVRVAGLSSSAGDGLAFPQAVAAMMASQLALAAPRRGARLGWTVVATACLASIMLTGRTGFAMFAVFVVVIGAGTQRALPVGSLLARIALLSAVSAVTAYLLLPDDLVRRLIDRLLPYAFEFAYNALAGEGLRTESTDDLRSMLFLPYDLSTLLLGGGYWVDPIDPRANYMGSDIGYVRTVYYVGVVGSVLVYAWYVLLWRELRTLARPRGMTRFMDGLFIVLFVAHVKFPFLFLGTGIGLMFALYFAFHLERDRCASAA